MTKSEIRNPKEARRTQSETAFEWSFRVWISCIQTAGWVRLNPSFTVNDASKSGRGLAALQDALGLSGRLLTPPGLGVRPVLCRFCFHRLLLTDSFTRTFSALGSY